MGDVILFIGPDGTGKTHIAQALSSRIGVPYFKNKGEWDHFEKPDDYFVNCMRYGDLGFFTQYLTQTGASVIMDRGYPCEWVYSKVFDRYTDLLVLSRIDEVYSELDARIIICARKDYSGVVDQFDSITPEKLVQIHDEYMNFATWTKCKSKVIFTDDENLERELREIACFLIA